MIAAVIIDTLSVCVHSQHHIIDVGVNIVVLIAVIVPFAGYKVILVTFVRVQVWSIFSCTYCSVVY